VVGLSPDVAPKPLIVVVVVELSDFASAKVPKPDLVDGIFPLNMLGFVAPRLPNGDVLEAASDAKPELTNADEVVFAFSFSGIVFFGDSDCLFSVCIAGAFVVSNGIGTIGFSVWKLGQP
jgi:hypothetical protein